MRGTGTNRPWNKKLKLFEVRLLILELKQVGKIVGVGFKTSKKDTLC